MNNFNYQKSIGGAESILAYLIWGLSPLFWKLLSGVSPYIIVANRVAWSCVMMLFIVAGYRQLPQVKTIFKDTKSLGLLLLCSCLMFCNWTIYIWAVGKGRVIQASFSWATT